MEAVNNVVAGRVVTLNSNGTRGAVLSRKHYELMRNVIISIFDAVPEITFTDLVSRVTQGNFIEPHDSAMWHLLKVKQDLQARGILRVRFVGVAPKQQWLRLNRKAIALSTVDSPPSFAGASAGKLSTAERS
jgi:hypothetical protein